MTAAGYVYCGCLVGFGLLAGLWLGYHLGWHLRGSREATLMRRVVNKHDNELAEHGERIRDLERRMAA